MFANSLIPRRVCDSSFLNTEFDKLFGHVLGSQQGRLSTYQSGDWQARLAVWEKDNDLHLELEIPGVSREDIELTVDDGVLKISGERKLVEDEDRHEHYSERRFGRFERVVRLPQQFDPESVAAELTEGVLHVTVAKTPEAQPKKVEVK